MWFLVGKRRYALKGRSRFYRAMNETINSKYYHFKYLSHPTYRYLYKIFEAVTRQHKWKANITFLARLNYHFSVTLNFFNHKIGMHSLWDYSKSFLVWNCTSFFLAISEYSQKPFCAPPTSFLFKNIISCRFPFFRWLTIKALLCDCSKPLIFVDK